MGKNSGKKQRNKKRLYLVLGIVLAALVLGGCLAWSHLRHPLAILRPEDPDGDGALETDIAKNFDKDVVNFLLMGFDRTAERDKIYTIYRPDTLLVISINFRSAEMVMLSIPRDSYVKIYGYSAYDKINATYMYGHEYGIEGIRDPHEAGLTCVVKTVEDLLGGIPIHYYITVDMDGVVEIVDKLGGIYYDVDLPIRDTRGRLQVEKGYQKLDGQKFLQYCSYRGVGGDTGRTQRQQELLIATFKQLKQAGKLVKIPQVYKSLTETVDTNLSVSQMASLALYGKEIDPDSIKKHVLVGSNQWAPQGELDISFLVIDERARVELIKELFGVEVEERPQITLPGPRPKPVEEEPPPEENGEEGEPGENGEGELAENGDPPPDDGEEDEYFDWSDPVQWNYNGGGDGPDPENNGGSGGAEPGEGEEGTGDEDTEEDED